MSFSRRVIRRSASWTALFSSKKRLPSLKASPQSWSSRFSYQTGVRLSVAMIAPRPRGIPSMIKQELLRVHQRPQQVPHPPRAVAAGGEARLDRPPLFIRGGPAERGEEQSIDDLAVGLARFEEALQSAVLGVESTLQGLAVHEVE